MIGATGEAARLLPWSGPEGEPCYVFGDGTGFVSRVADNVESVQLDMAAELLDHAADMLEDPQVTSAQLRFLTARMAEALRDVHRIAEPGCPPSRTWGGRLRRERPAVPGELPKPAGAVIMEQSMKFPKNSRNLGFASTVP